MAAAIDSKLEKNVPYEVSTKCSYFSCGFEIQDGRSGLRLADKFSTSSQGWL